VVRLLLGEEVQADQGPRHGDADGPAAAVTDGAAAAATDRDAKAPAEFTWPPRRDLVASQISRIAPVSMRKPSSGLPEIVVKNAISSRIKTIGWRTLANSALRGEIEPMPACASCFRAPSAASVAGQTYMAKILP
jgi:hypothetical protein